MFKFSFDENGHEVAHFPEQVAKLAEDLQYQSTICKDDSKRARLLANAANCYRTIKRLDAAESCINQALQLVETNSQSYYIYLLRKANVLQWLKKFDQALNLYDKVLQECPDLRHYALQHRGKCFLDMGKYPNALKDIEQSLALRKQLCDKDLIESSKFALNLVQKRIKKTQE